MNLASEQMVAAGWVLVGLYAAAILALVLRGAGRTRQLSDYALGSVLFSPAAVGLSLAASITSAATFIINPGFVAVYGVSAIIGMAFALPLAALLSLVVLTKGFRRHGASAKALSMADWMKSMFGSRALGFLFGWLSLLLLTFVVLICVGLTKVLASMLNLPEMTALAAIVVFVFGYMMFGGANSMVYTNTIQALLMLVVAVVLLGSGAEALEGGLPGLLERLRAIDPALVRITRPDSFLFRDLFEILAASVIVGVAIVCQPHILTKSLLLKHEDQVNRYLAVGATVQLLFFLVVVTGLFARLTFPDLSADGQPIPLDGVLSAYVVSRFPVALALLVVMGLLSAGLSTLEGLVQSVSTSITHDLLRPMAGQRLERPVAGVPGELFWNRIVILAMGTAAFFLSRGQLLDPKLSVGIFAQNGVYAYFSAAFTPIVLGMFFKGVPARAALGAAVSAVLVHFTYYYAKLPLPFTLADGENPGVAASVAILTGLAVGFTLYRMAHGRFELRKAAPAEPERRAVPAADV